MKLVIALLAVLGLAMAGGAAVPTLAAAGSSYELALDAGAAQGGAPAQLEVDVDVDEGGGAWWANPVWIAIGVIAFVLLIVIVTMAARGGGTTVIKE